MSHKQQIYKEEEDWIFGRNAILSCLERKEAEGKDDTNFSIQLEKIFLAQGLAFDRRIEKIKQLAREQSIPIIVCDKQQLDRLVGSQAKHQGIASRISQTKSLSLSEFLATLPAPDPEKNKLPNMLVAVADGIQDPHNFGAIIRVALAAGAKGLITSHRRSAGTTGTVAKASAGAIAYLPIVKVKNIVSTLEELKRKGFWIAGLDAEGKDDYFASDLRLPLALVIGSEGTGISRLVAEHCDFLLRIPMAAKSESLNASVAAGIVFYEYVRQNLCEEK